MVLLALCFPLLMGAFLLVMEGLEAVLLPVRPAAVPGPKADDVEPEGPPVPRSLPSSEQETDPLAA